MVAGRVDARPTLASTVASAGLLVHPAHFDGMPNAVLEALALGTPVLATTDLEVLRELSLAPTYFSHSTTLVLAEDLYPESLPGDEPEPLEVIPWPLDRLHELMLREDCSEGRSLAALFIVRELIRLRGGA